MEVGGEVGGGGVAGVDRNKAFWGNPSPPPRSPGRLRVRLLAGGWRPRERAQQLQDYIFRLD